MIEFGKSIGLDRNALSHLPLNSFYEYQKGIINNLNVGEVLYRVSLEGRNQRKIENNIELPNLITKEQDFFIW